MWKIMSLKLRLLLFVILSLVLVERGNCDDCQDAANQSMVEEDPEDLLVDLGQTEGVSFHCSYSGNSVDKFIWQHFPLVGNKEVIGESNSAKCYQINSTNGDLIITEVKPFHAGLYQCSLVLRIGDANCPVDTANATLTVKAPPQVFWSGETTPTNLTISVPSAGQDLIQANVFSFAPPQISVKRSSGDAVTEGLFTVSVDFVETGKYTVSVTIHNPRVGDEGGYKLVANNSKGPSELYLEIKVTGPDPPEITVEELYLLEYGAEVSANCSVQLAAASSSEGIQLTWLRNNQVIPTQSNSAPNVYTILGDPVVDSPWIILKIVSLNATVTGTYVCTANNSRGNDDDYTKICGPPPKPSAPTVLLCGSGSQDCWRTIRWTASVYGCTTIAGYTVFIKNSGNIVVMEQEVEGQELEYNIPTSLALDPGSYKVQVSATAGSLETMKTVKGPKSEETNLIVDAVPEETISEKTSTDDDLVPIVVSVASAGFLILLLTITFGTVVFFLCCYYPHKKRLTSQEQTWSPDDEMDNGTVPNSYTTLKLPPSDLPPSPESLPFSIFSAEIDPKWEFPRENLQLTEVLHEGQFTVLYKGMAKGIREQPLEVAVKSVREDATEDDVKALIAEMEVLSSIGPHPNIVSLMRVCTVGKPIYMVVEYMCHGDLLGFMRAARGHHGMYTISPGIRNQPPCLNLSSRDLLSIGSKIANGMRYLADRKIVHRALCSRHVLVGAGFEIKLYNVGSFDSAVDTRDGLLKWLAPETLFDGTYSIYTDVWSFGITLWELVTLGGTPYAEIEPEDLYTQLHAGMRMPRPMHCSHEIYEVMRKCWERNPTDRPHFADIHDQIDTLATAKVSYIDLRSYNPVEYSQYDDQPQLSTAL